jgi:adenylate cyclase
VIALYEHALTLDPRSADAQSWLAIVLASRALDVMTDTATADLERAESLARQALTALSRSSFAHYARGEVLRVKRRYGEALPEYEAARSANPNYVHALHALALCKIYTGSIEEAIPLEEQAIRLSPRDAFIGNWYAAISFAHLLQSRTNEAIIWAQKARNANPAHPIFRVRLASAFALAGETQRAAAELAEARRLSSDDRFSSLARFRTVENYESLVPKVRAQLETTYIASLVNAGMPEE